MDDLQANSTSPSSLLIVESTLTRYLKFAVLLVLEPPALVCNSFLVYSLLSNGHLRTALQHHVILALLLVTLLSNLIEIPRVLHYLLVGVVRPESAVGCLIWQWCDYLLFALANMLMLWASFERHLLVFHSHLFSNQRTRFFLHYFPLAFIVLYLLLFYTILIFAYSCDSKFDFSKPLCGSPCFTDHSLLSLYDLLVHSWIPTLFIALFSVGLVLRVLYQKRLFLRQHGQWRKYRRMILQLLSISFVYLICMGPYTLVQIIDLLAGLSPLMTYVENVYLFYVYWLLMLLLPFVCIGCVPELTNKLNRQLKKWICRTNTVMPVAH